MDESFPGMPVAEDVENAKTNNSRPVGDGTVGNERRVSIFNLFSYYFLDQNNDCCTLSVVVSSKVGALYMSKTCQLTALPLLGEKSMVVVYVLRVHFASG